MAKRCIGIDIGSTYLRAVQVSRTNGKFSVEKVFSTQTRRSTDYPPDILASLTSRHGFDHRANIAVAMPHNSVFFRDLHVDSAGLQQIRTCKAPQLQNCFPIPQDKIIAQASSQHQLPDDRFSVLVAAVNRDSLNDRLTTLSEAKLQPGLVDAPILAIRSAIAVNHPESSNAKAVIVYIDNSYLTFAVTEDSDILFVRNIPIISGSDSDIYSLTEQVAKVLSRELQLTWQKVFNSRLEPDTCIYLAAGVNLPKSLLTILKEDMHCRITIVNPYAVVERRPDSNATAEISLAQGLALHALAPAQASGVNFLQADTAGAKKPLNLKKEFVIFAILATAIAAVSLAGLFVRLARLENRYSQIKSEITHLFRSTLPDEKNIVSPLTQLQQKLKSLQTDYRLFARYNPARLAPLEVLHSITKSIPPQGDIEIDDLLITDESIRLNGTCNSFETVYRWQRLLRNVTAFKLVDVQDVRKQPKSGKVRFTILISSVISEQK
ncbi:MAG: pilus assembly protein PilM [Planctomycetota bacterium]|jgi:Tfp pilus assembly protein PilN